MPPVAIDGAREDDQLLDRSVGLEPAWPPLAFRPDEIPAAVTRIPSRVPAAGSGGDERQGIWINLHADPNPEYPPDETIDQLHELLGLARYWGHRLTILFTGQWLEYLIGDSAARAQVANWLLIGHQIGFHHHDVSHTGGDGWDGYQSLEDDDCLGSFLLGYSHTQQECDNAGSVEDAFSLFDELTDLLRTESDYAADVLPDSGIVANHGTDRALRQQEWQAGASYSQGSRLDVDPCWFVAPSLDTSIHAIDSARCVTYNSLDVGELSGQHFDVGTTGGISTENVLDDLHQAQQAEYVGVSIHPWEFRDATADTTFGAPTDKEKIAELFEELFESGVRATPLRDILSAEAPCDVASVC